MGTERTIDEVYERYAIIAGMTGQVESLTKEQFINKVNTDDEFGLGKRARIGGADAVPMELAATRNEG